MTAPAPGVPPNPVPSGAAAPLPNGSSSGLAAKETWRQRRYREWDQFWFSPADPTLLGLIRIGCGVITLYTMIAYCFDMQEFLGEHAWLDRETRLNLVRNRPTMRHPLTGKESPMTPPRNKIEEQYLDEYVAKFKELPPAPAPQNDVENFNCQRFREYYGFDLRTNGLPPPQDDYQLKFLEKFAARYRQAPAPPYPRTDREVQEIFDYFDTYGVDPHRLLSRGIPAWSLWFYVTDPAGMAWLHALVLLVVTLFLIGFCTRITSALTWFFFLNYIHRVQYVMFGADTMMSILLLYLMIGPSGAALSVDRLILRWWSKNKLGVVNRWRGLLRRPPLSTAELVPAVYEETPPPSVGANFAVRLLQIHLCIIYFAAGIAKLQGATWWNGTAVWYTIANYEMAPMRSGVYNYLLHFLAHNEIVFHTFLFVGSYFTLAFEMGYAFLIWLPRTRLLMLAAALVLHGLIGTLMGLSSFAIIMVVMNFAFLNDREAHWLVENFSRWPRFLGLPRFIAWRSQNPANAKR